MNKALVDYAIAGSALAPCQNVTLFGEEHAWRKCIYRVSAQNQAATTTMLATAATSKIDVHHHIFLPQLARRKASQNEAVGWKTPAENMPWSIEKSLNAMDELGIARAVLSYPAGVPENLVENPFRAAACGAGDLADVDEDARREENRKVVRELNTHAKELCDAADARGRFGWFACLPDLRNVEGEAMTILLEHNFAATCVVQVPCARLRTRWTCCAPMV